MNRVFRGAFFPIVLVIVLAFFVSRLIPSGSSTPAPTYQTLTEQWLPAGKIKTLTIKPSSNDIDFTTYGGKSYSVGFVGDQQVNQIIATIKTLNTSYGAGHTLYNEDATSTSAWPTILIDILPFLIFFGLWFLVMNNLQGGGSKVMSFGKSRAKRLSADSPKITFRDVAGVDEAVEELHEIKEFLENPKKFQALGARIPKGVLLYGPPGTGKTLLARAVAGEAGVPFFSINGSEFVEMFVGVGAARVRDLFTQARANAPCIIFIDELDALGRARGISGLSGGHDEKEQTLNQLLSELDGFDPTIGVVLLAATNRPEVLDPALLRAGRFDRQVSVDRPDKIGRVGILQVHLKKIKLATDVDPAAIAALTPGFTGADLANLVNEAAVLATRRRAQSVSLEDFTAAIERVIAGPEKRNRLLNPRERRIVAFHEMGHAIVAMALPDTDSIKKVSIIPRGIGALGYTMQMPTEDRYLMTRTELLNRMTVLLGGRAAEMVIFAEATTGAADDLQRATEMARAMVTRYGMEPEIGQASLVSERPRYLDLSELGQRQSEASDETNAKIDNAIRNLIEQAFNRACDILRSCARVHQESAQRLLDKETFVDDDLAANRAAVTQCRDPGATTTSGAGTETA